MEYYEPDQPEPLLNPTLTSMIRRGVSFESGLKTTQQKLVDKHVFQLQKDRTKKKNRKERLVTRNLVLNTSGYYHATFVLERIEDLVVGDSEEEGDGTNDVEEGEEEDDKTKNGDRPSSSNGSTLSRRERLRRRILRRKKEIQVEVNARDVHDRPVFVVDSHNNEKIPLGTYTDLAHMYEASNVVGEMPRHPLEMTNEKPVSECFFFVDSENLPIIVDISIRSYRNAVVRGDVYRYFTDLHANSFVHAVDDGDTDTDNDNNDDDDDGVSVKGKELLNAALSPERPGTEPTGSSSRKKFLGQRHESWPIRGSSSLVSPTHTYSETNKTTSYTPPREPMYGRQSSYESSSTLVDDDTADLLVGQPISASTSSSSLSTTIVENQDSLLIPPVSEQQQEVSLPKDAPVFRGAPLKYEEAHLQTTVMQGDGSTFQQSAPSATLRPLVTKGRWFCEYNGPDAVLGRTVLLRGVNLSGNCKLPYRPKCPSHLRFDWGSLKDPKVAADLSFVGRPFPLEEAKEHFSRLRRWGFNCLRFLTTWEAIEHAGPGIYDNEYLDYLELVVRIAGSYGFYVFIDPHQDVWSRMTGGSGAPAWTLTLAGLDLAKLEDSEAAFTHNSSANPLNFQRMSWPQNYQRFAALHMFTLFWGGNDFAPKFAVDGGIPIQEYLQKHFINAMLEIVKRVKDMPHVLGFDSFNEPSPGFIGNRLDEYLDPVIPPGPVFRPFDSMCCAAGFSRNLNKANSIGLMTGRYLANPNHVSAWLDGAIDVWRDHGVWDIAQISNDAGEVMYQPRLLQPDYFCHFPNSPGKVEFFRDYLRPFMVLYISRIRQLMPRAILFAEGDGFGEKEFIWDHGDPLGVVNASHWYDGFTLFKANFNPRFSVDVKTKRPVFGQSRIYAMHYRDLKEIMHLPVALNGEKVVMPTLIGEFGLPFNMNNKSGYKNGDFRLHERAMSLYYDLMDSLHLHSTQWNYCSDNNNLYGDNWNLEDLSLFSRDQQTESSDKDINSGGRGILGFSRPYAPFCCGVPVLTVFNQSTRTFEFSYTPNSRNFTYGDYSFATEIFVPDIQYILGGSKTVVEFDIVVEGGKFRKRQLPGRHILYIWADKTTMSKKGTVHVKIMP